MNVGGKTTPRIYLTFRTHAKAIMNQHYRGVYLLFDWQADLEHYRTLFDVEAWPEYDFHPQKGKITKLSTTFTPDTVPQLRQRFVFTLEEASPPVPTEAPPPEVADPAPDERRAAVRDEDPDASHMS